MAKNGQSNDPTAVAAKCEAACQMLAWVPEDECSTGRLISIANRCAFLWKYLERGTGMIHAEDLFFPDEQCSIPQIAAAFRAVPWPNLSSPGACRNLHRDIEEMAAARGLSEIQELAQFKNGKYYFPKRLYGLCNAQGISPPRRGRLIISGKAVMDGLPAAANEMLPRLLVLLGYWRSCTPRIFLRRKQSLIQQPASRVASKKGLGIRAGQKPFLITTGGFPLILAHRTLKRGCRCQIGPRRRKWYGDLES